MESRSDDAREVSTVEPPSRVLVPKPLVDTEGDGPVARTVGFEGDRGVERDGDVRDTDVQQVGRPQAVATWRPVAGGTRSQAGSV